MLQDSKTYMLLFHLLRYMCVDTKGCLIFYELYITVLNRFPFHVKQTLVMISSLTLYILMENLEQ